jgi:hypothetical protein
VKCGVIKDGMEVKTLVFTLEVLFMFSMKPKKMRIGLYIGGFLLKFYETKSV